MSLQITSREQLLERAKQGFDYWQYGAQPDVLGEFPAAELICLDYDQPGRDWPSVWLAAGGKLIGKRMIALKWDPVWEQISIWKVPYPPFDLFDNMDMDDVGCSDAVKLGLIAAGACCPFMIRSWNDDLERLAMPVKGLS